MQICQIARLIGSYRNIRHRNVAVRRQCRADPGGTNFSTNPYQQSTWKSKVRSMKPSAP